MADEKPTIDNETNKNVEATGQADITQARTPSRRLSDMVSEDNQVLIRMLDNPQIGGILSGIIVIIWVVAKVGVPAILALQSLLLQLADREPKPEQVVAEQALNDKVDEIPEAIEKVGDDLGVKIDGLSKRVDNLEHHQNLVDETFHKSLKHKLDTDG